MKKLLFGFLILANFNLILAQSIPVDAILLDEVTSIDFNAHGDILKVVSKKYKILNQKGENIARFVEFYDENTSIYELKIEIYDKNFNHVVLSDKNSISDRSEYSGYTNYSDDRMMYCNIEMQEFPYYIFYRYKKKYKGNLMSSRWSPQSSRNLEINNASLILNVDKSIKINYKTFNIENACSIDSSSDFISYKFSIDSIAVKEYEAFSPSRFELFPIILFSPINFNYDGYEGSFASWNTFGNWIKELNKGRDELDKAGAVKLHDLVKDCKDTTEMVEKVYKYVQDNTRYVSIQFGIGGFQPFLASEVDKNGYGDCKALSFYTQSLLKELGIKSNYTLVYAGSSVPDIQVDFPSNQFNHVILNVPLKNDTIWLECTDQNSPFGYLGDFTSDRHVLSIGDEIEIIKTPDYSKKNNYELNYAEFEINNDGSAKAFFSNNKKGILFDEYYYLVHEGKSEQEEWIYKHAGLNDFTINNFDVSYIDDRIPSAQISYDCNLNSLGKLSGKRMFIPIKLGPKMENLPSNSKNRINDIVLNNSLTVKDSSIFILPPDFEIEYLPGQKTIESEFGKLNCSSFSKDGIIIFIRTLELEKGRFSSDQYKDFLHFYTELLKSENEKIVLIRSKS